MTSTADDDALCEGGRPYAPPATASTYRDDPRCRTLERRRLFAAETTVTSAAGSWVEKLYSHAAFDTSHRTNASLCSTGALGASLISARLPTVAHTTTAAATTITVVTSGDDVAAGWRRAAGAGACMLSMLSWVATSPP